MRTSFIGWDSSTLGPWLVVLSREVGEAWLAMGNKSLGVGFELHCLPHTWVFLLWHMFYTCDLSASPVWSPHLKLTAVLPHPDGLLSLLQL